MVIQEIDGGCPDGTDIAIGHQLTRHGVDTHEWPVKIPANAPGSESCIFAWSWINAIGNREYYMNCADIKITGGAGSSITGAGLLLANIGGYQILQPPAHDATGPNAADTKIVHIPIQVA